MRVSSLWWPTQQVSHDSKSPKPYQNCAADPHYEAADKSLHTCAPSQCGCFVDSLHKHSFMTLMAFGCSLNDDACRRRFTSRTVRSSLRRSSPLSTVFNLSMSWIPEELDRFDQTSGWFSWSDAEISGVMDNNVTGGNLRRSQVNVPGGGAAQTSHSYFYFHNRAERKFKGILRGNHDSERNPIAVLRLHYLPNPTYRLSFSQPEIWHIFSALRSKLVKST